MGLYFTVESFTGRFLPFTNLFYFSSEKGRVFFLSLTVLIPITNRYSCLSRSTLAATLNASTFLGFSCLQKDLKFSCAISL